MITQSDIKTGNQFKTADGIIWNIDKIVSGTVSTSMEGGAKGNYKDDLDEVVAFLNEENSELIKK